ncbi:MAG: hypothetical protein H7328_01895 [Bdellovibrio sp.]|nr:hypothetical protein [Bdellovibrio sp.]
MKIVSIIVSLFATVAFANPATTTTTTKTETAPVAMAPAAGPAKVTKKVVKTTTTVSADATHTK